MPPVASTAITPRPASDSPTDIDLIPLAIAGSANAFTTLFHRHYHAIHAFSYRLCLCTAEAEDIAQETFIHAARALSTFRREASFKNWLYTIATNRTRDRLRQRQRRVRRDAVLAAEPEFESTHHPADLPAETDAHIAIRTALADLTSDQREAVTLVYYENLNHAEAARVLGCAESTISWRLFRAKSKLKKTLRASAHSRHD